VKLLQRSIDLYAHFFVNWRLSRTASGNYKLAHRPLPLQSPKKTSHRHMRSKICQLLQTSFVNSADFQNLLGCMLAACSAARKRNAVPEAVPEALVSKPESTVARACHGEFDTCCCLGSKLCSETCATCSILAGSVILCIMADLGETGRGQFRDLADLSLLTQRNPKSNHTICVQMFHDTCRRVVLHCCAFFDTHFCGMSTCHLFNSNV
jgi:hypothetical protein